MESPWDAEAQEAVKAAAMGPAVATGAARSKQETEPMEMPDEDNTTTPQAFGTRVPEGTALEGLTAAAAVAADKPR